MIKSTIGKAEVSMYVLVLIYLSHKADQFNSMFNGIFKIPNLQGRAIKEQKKFSDK